MKALILVDLQNDFVEGGALAVRGGREVIPIANQLLSSFSLVVATQDWHPNDHGSFASQHAGLRIGDQFTLDGLPQVAWPDHCVQGSYGAMFVDTLHVDSIDHVVRKGTDKLIDSYSGFFDNGHRQATGLHDYLQQHNVTELFILGLATDYCVKFTALDAIELGYRVSLVLEGCRGVDLTPGDVDRAINTMEQAGVTIIRDWKNTCDCRSD